MKRPIILASGSPRRQQLMKEAGFEFTIRIPKVEEDFPDTLPVEEVALYLAKKKAGFFKDTLLDEIVITADTTVVLDQTVMNKPADRQEGIDMLTRLSGKTHAVITGVCILSREKEVSFLDKTLVTFKDLRHQEIEFYLDQYLPYDKAGAYGIQDWIGLIGITRIEGSYFNVMGLPIHKIYQYLV